MVLRLCVMMMNWVWSIIDLSISMNRLVFASSSGASISSSRQNGLTISAMSGLVVGHSLSPVRHQRLVGEADPTRRLAGLGLPPAQQGCDKEAKGV